MALQLESDSALLDRFHSQADEPAFTLLVERHLRVVFAVAQNRLGGDTQLAEDVCQIVFSQLARNAKSLRHHSNIKAWLFKTSRFTASKLVRARVRQKTREQDYEYVRDLPNPKEKESLTQFIDELIEQLPSSDQEVLLLRYFESMDYKTIGTRLSIKPNTARMRAERALVKLQARFKKRGIATGTALSAALNAYASCSLPAHLATSVTNVTLASLGSLASIGLVSALKLPLAASLAILLTGVAIERQNTSAAMDSNVAIEQPPRAHAEQAVSPPSARSNSSALDNIDLAYAALDKDATVLAQRLEAIESAIQKLHNRRPAPEKIYSLSELDTKPRASAMMMPEYPISHLVTKEEGRAVVEFVLGTDGKTSDLRVVKASHPDFGKNALEAVSKSEFTPGRIGATAVQSRVRIPIMFTPSPTEDQAETQNWF
ncbi:TonB family protein [Pelagicoccus sp. SDUM812005]|uniref:TonB family protein n=1 Tax=Pelagicoccus sp. SDUM812005 TaxID=3041257 RepID=UPI00280F52E6|nr:TonB family protein [Pelagicoccus sp. SDUM812005]MDQ8180663.1 TonB family protein [Pelagicoccus sp. SDUM812005]